MNTPEVTKKVGIVKGTRVEVATRPFPSDKNPEHLIYKLEHRDGKWVTAKSGLVAILKKVPLKAPETLVVSGLPMSGMYVFVEAI